MIIINFSYRNQFHDVLPGSCIEDVVKDAVGIYESNLLLCEKLLDSALQSISANYIGFEKGLSNQLNFSSDFLCFNSCSWKRFDIVELPLLEFDGFSQISHDNRIIGKFYYIFEFWL
jgi:alpha-mannosidase